MITCPECGKANKEGSKFCIQCGRALAVATRPAAGSVAYWGNVVVPDWLLGLQAQLPEELRDPDLEEMARARQSAAAGAAEARTSDAADRLSSLRDQGGASEQTTTPMPQTAAPKEDAWLQGLLSATKSTEAGPGAPASATGEEKLPDWLTDLRSTMYEKTQQIPTVSGAKPAGSEPAEAEVPDWLRQETYSKEPTSAGPTPTELPAAETPKPPIAAVPAVDAMPDWLKQLDAPASTPPQSSGLAQAQKADAEPPDWLHDLSRLAAASEPSLPAPAQPSSSPGIGPEAELPEWLKGLQEPDSSSPSSAAPEMPAPESAGGTPRPAGQESFEATPGAVQSSVPEWLRGTAAERAPLSDAEPPLGPVPDWLRGPDQAAAAALAKSPVPPAEDTSVAAAAASEPPDQLPDWLRSFRTEAPTGVTGELPALEPPAGSPGRPPAETTPEATPPETEIPDWVLRTGEPPEPRGPVPETRPDVPGEESPLAVPSLPQAEVPDWLVGLTEPRVGEPPLPPGEEAAPEPGAPDWLQSASPASGEPVTPRMKAPSDSNAVSEGEMPEWLRNIRAEAPFGEHMEPPAWVTSPEAELNADELPQEELPRVEEETPSWLAGVPLAPAPEIAGDNMPDWLRELDQKTPVTPSGGVAVAHPEVEGEPEVAEGHVPDWLKQMGAIDATASESGRTPAPAAPSVVPAAPPSGPRPSDELRPPVPPFERSGAVIPPKPTPPPSPARTLPVPPVAPSVPVRTPPMTMADLLSGVSGALAAEQAIAAVKPGQPTGGAGPVPSAVSEAAAEAGAFETIVSQPLLAPAEVTERPRRQFWPWFGRLVLSLLIIGAVALPLTWQGERSFFSEYNIPISPRTVQMYNQINDLPLGTPVGVILDYDPSLSEELNLQARVLFGHLMQRKTRLLVLSTTPTGPEIAQRLLDRLAAQPANKYVYGKDYLNMGYLPGQEASLSMFARSPLSAVRVDFKTGAALESFPIVADLKQAPVDGLGKVLPLMVLVSGSQEGLRAWIEQVGVPSGVRLIAGVSGGVEPYAQTYVASGQLAGLLSGAPGAAEYEAQSQLPGAAVRGLDSQAAVHLLLVVLIVLGNLVFGVRRLFGRRR